MPQQQPKAISGADILMQCLVDHGVDTVFAYPGGASMPMHQALTRFQDRIRTILPRHEQGGGFMAGRLCTQHGPGRRLLRHQWAGGDQLRHLPCRRQDGLGADHRHHRPGRHPRHRHRRLPRDADRRGLSAHHQASLSRHQDRGHSARHEGSVPCRDFGSAGPGHR